MPAHLPLPFLGNARRSRSLRPFGASTLVLLAGASLVGCRPHQGDVPTAPMALSTAAKTTPPRLPSPRPALS